jgi:hypothetical protein
MSSTAAFGVEHASPEPADAPGPLAEKINAMPNYVASSTLRASSGTSPPRSPATRDRGRDATARGRIHAATWGDRVPGPPGRALRSRASHVGVSKKRRLGPRQAPHRPAKREPAVSVADIRIRSPRVGFCFPGDEQQRGRREACRPGAWPSAARRTPRSARGCGASAGVLGDPHFWSRRRRHRRANSSSRGLLRRPRSAGRSERHPRGARKTAALSPGHRGVSRRE